MDFPIQQMSLSEFVDLQAQLGMRIERRGRHSWRRVRPFFYRPVLPTEEINQVEVQPPCGWPGGFQYGVSDSQQANSTIDLIVLEDLKDYSIEGLGHKRRNLIRSAAKRFEVRPLRSLEELKEHGYKVFLTFHNRTGYSYRSDRTNRAIFEGWSNALFKQPKSILLGAYSGGQLVGVSCSYWVERVLVYSTLFCDTEALKKNLGELLFHELRQLVARQTGIDCMLIRVYQAGNSLDQYYLLRGCKLVRKPARLEVPRVTQTFIRLAFPKQYALLRGGS